MGTNMDTAVCTSVSAGRSFVSIYTRTSSEVNATSFSLQVNKNPGQANATII